MYTALVTYTLPNPRSRAAMLERFKQSEARFQSLPNLVRKDFCYDEASHTGHSVYLWDSEAAARGFFSEAFLTGFEKSFGCRPNVVFVDTLLVVDNQRGNT